MYIPMSTKKCDSFTKTLICFSENKNIPSAFQSAHLKKKYWQKVT